MYRSSAVALAPLRHTAPVTTDNKAIKQNAAGTKGGNYVIYELYSFVQSIQKPLPRGPMIWRRRPSHDEGKISDRLAESASSSRSK